MKIKLSKETINEVKGYGKVISYSIDIIMDCGLSCKFDGRSRNLEFELEDFFRYKVKSTTNSHSYFYSRNSF